MEYLIFILLGFIQGITEFLPVSSSGHLKLGEVLFNVNLGNDVTFSLFLHLATSLSIMVVFHKELTHLVLNVFKKDKKVERSFVVNLLISALPVFILYLIFGNSLDSLASTNLVNLGISFIFTALLLAGTYIIKVKEKSISYFNSFIMGIAQCIALIPGVSRSAITIVTGLELGISKDEVTKFSFIMSLIPIVGATIIKTISAILAGTFDISSFDILFAGFISAFITGIFAIKFMLKFVSNNSIYLFSPYLVLLGIVSFVLYFIR